MLRQIEWTYKKERTFATATSFLKKINLAITTS